jgi:hypothetical protein
VFPRGHEKKEIPPQEFDRHALPSELGAGFFRYWGVRDMFKWRQGELEAQ